MFGFFLFAGLFVALCLFTAEPAAPVPVVDDLPSLEELLAEAEELIAKPLPPLTAALVAQAQAAAIAAPVAVAVVKVETPAKPIAQMTSAELRKECGRRAIAWRNAHGKGKHMLKGEMVEALS
ncbi:MULTISPECIES: hypothetical protein [Cyanophyceae]|uniref:Uncharacterized protein n=1 Tax=Leptolyngbya subtilissima DQ-A4 TaxID=2933933 RepID=A0ABV0KEI4_9CYAN|nr:hypothetical protein [Nodosilinea sp. FACHB-141]MBD2111739.1 hypothetical protein [Nodosilinea sp. FACHB-141]